MQPLTRKKYLQMIMYVAVFSLVCWQINVIGMVMGVHFLTATGVPWLCISANCMHLPSLIVSLACAHLCLEEQRSGGREKESLTGGEQREDEWWRFGGGRRGNGRLWSGFCQRRACLRAAETDRMRWEGNFAATIDLLLSRCSLTCQAPCLLPLFGFSIPSFFSVTQSLFLLMSDRTKMHNNTLKGCTVILFLTWFHFDFSYKNKR